MSRFIKRTIGSISILAAALLVTGCGPSLPQRLQYAKTGNYVFHHSATDVEAATRQLLKDSGYELLAPSQDGTVRTEWRAYLDDEQFATAYDRYVVVVHRLSPEHCRVTAAKVAVATLGMETSHPMSQSNGDGLHGNVNTVVNGKGTSPLPIGPPSARRDFDFEWKLISREEPERARAVQSEIAWLAAHR